MRLVSVKASFVGRMLVPVVGLFFTKKWLREWRLWFENWATARRPSTIAHSRLMFTLDRLVVSPVSL